jgi:hypothetical protein
MTVAGCGTKDVCSGSMDKHKQNTTVDVSTSQPQIGQPTPPRGQVQGKNSMTGRTPHQLQQQGSHTRSYTKDQAPQSEEGHANALAVKRVGHTRGTSIVRIDGPLPKAPQPPPSRGTPG